MFLSPLNAVPSLLRLLKRFIMPRGIVGYFPPEFLSAASEGRIHVDIQDERSSSTSRVCFTDTKVNKKWEVRLTPVPAGWSEVRINGCATSSSELLLAERRSWSTQDLSSSDAGDRNDGRLESRVCHTLAVKSLTKDEICRLLQVKDTDGLDGVLQRVSHKDSSSNEYCLNAEGFGQVNIEQFAGEEKRLVASRAFGQLPSDSPELDSFLPYIDRDCLLTSKGGVMSGLGIVSADKRKRERSPEEPDGTVSSQTKTPLRPQAIMFTSLRSLPWMTFDLRDVEDSSSDVVKKICSSPGPIDSRSIPFEGYELKKLHSLLVGAFTRMSVALHTHAALTLQAKAWRKTIHDLTAVCTPEVIAELQTYWETQVTARVAMEGNLTRLNAAIHGLEAVWAERVFLNQVELKL